MTNNKIPKIERASPNSSRMTTGNYLSIALAGIGCVVLGFGQACSSGGGSGSSSNLSSSANDTGTTSQVSTLSLLPNIQQTNYSANASVKASGGVEPYTYRVVSGGGSIITGTGNSSAGVFSAPAQDATVSVGVTDASGKTAFAVIVVSATPTSSGSTGTYAKEFQGSYAKMNTLVNGCNETQPIGPECNQAIINSCVAAGFGTGFGPVEHSGDKLIYTCIINGAYVENKVNFAALSFYQPTCTAANPLSDACMSASNRYCITTGKVGGFGPVTFNSQAGNVECMLKLTDVRLEIQYSELTTLVPDCTNDTAYSGQCFSAARRYCRKQGYVSSYGISEHGGGKATLDCLR